MNINGRNYTLLRDYDMGLFHYLTFSDKTLYLKERVDRFVIRPCDAGNKANLNLGLIIATGICAAISAASTFLKGQEAPRGQDKNYFVDFVTTYMDPVLQQTQTWTPGRTWVVWLYEDLRCGLSHSFTIENGGIEYELSSYVHERPYGPEVNPTFLLNDFTQAFTKYLADVTADGPSKGLGAFFEKRFDDIFHD